MRVALAISLTLLVSSATPAAQKPIPQDPARMEAHSRAAQEWHRRTFRGEYDRVGKKDSRWDVLAHETLELIALEHTGQFEPMVSLGQVQIPAKKAIDAGCDDPLMLYCFARSSVGKDYPGPEEYIRRIRAAADALSTSSYSPYRRASASEAALSMMLGNSEKFPIDRAEIGRKLDAILDLLPKSVAEDPRGEEWEDVWYRLIENVFALQLQLKGDRKAAYDHVLARIEKVDGIEALRLLVEGEFYMRWGWEARGNGYASTVGAEGFRLFEERLGVAREKLEAAYKANPKEPHVAQTMMEVEKAVGGGDRKAIDLWFERAMIADGNDNIACLTMLDWLEPKWYGDDEGQGMVDFGRACGATKNWRNGIMTFAPAGHYRRFKLMDPQDWKGYLKTPEVWADFSSTYPEFLKHYPEANIERSRYAMACKASEHYDEAHEQFQILGDDLAEWKASPVYSLEEMKKARDQTATYLEALAKYREAQKK